MRHGKRGPTRCYDRTSKILVWLPHDKSPCCGVVWFKATRLLTESPLVHYDPINVGKSVSFGTAYCLIRQRTCGAFGAAFSPVYFFMATATRQPRTAKKKICNARAKRLAATAKKHADDERIKRIVERQIKDNPLFAMATASIADEDDHIRVMFGIPANVEPTEQQRERYRTTNQQRLEGLRSRNDLMDEHLQSMQLSLVQYHIDVINNPNAKRTAKNISAVELRHLAAQRIAHRTQVELEKGNQNTGLEESELDELLKVYG